MVESSEEVIPKGWWYNESSRLYFLAVEDDQERYRGNLISGNFNKQIFLQVRDGVSLKPGLEEGMYFSFGFGRGEWSGYESILFDPTTRVHQIDSQRWKSNKEGLEFQDLYKHSAPHLHHHWQKLYTAPHLEQDKGSLDYLHDILTRQEEKKKGFRVIK